MSQQLEFHVSDHGFISSACISFETARAAKVHWLSDTYLIPEVVRIAQQMGYSAKEIAQVGELLEDLHEMNVVFRKGTVVIPDDTGMPSGLVRLERA